MAAPPPRTAITRFTAKSILERPSLIQSEASNSSLATLYDALEPDGNGSQFTPPPLKLKLKQRVTAKDLLKLSGTLATAVVSESEAKDKQEIPKQVVSDSENPTQGGECPFARGGTNQKSRKNQVCPVTGQSGGDQNTDCENNAVLLGCSFMTKKQLDPVDLLLKAPNNQIDYLQAEVEDLMNGIPQTVLKKHEESQQSTTASVNGGTSKSRLTARQLLGLDSISPVLSSALPPKPALAIATTTTKANSYDSMLDNIDVNLRDLNVSSENEDFDVDDLLDGYGTEETKTVDPASIPKPVSTASTVSTLEPQQVFHLESAVRLTNSEILTRLDSILKQWFREFNPAQFMKSYNGLNNSHYTTILLNNLLNDAMGKGGVAVAHTARLLPHLVTEKYFTLNDIRSSLAKIASTIWKLEPHIQSCYKYFGILYGAMMVQYEEYFSIEILNEILEPLLDYEERQDILRAPSALAHTLETVLLMKGEKGLKAMYKRQNFDLQQFWPKSKSRFEIEDWMDESGLECLIEY